MAGERSRGRGGDGGDESVGVPRHIQRAIVSANSLCFISKDMMEWNPGPKTSGENCTPVFFCFLFFCLPLSSSLPPHPDLNVVNEFPQRRGRLPSLFGLADPPWTRRSLPHFFHFAMQLGANGFIGVFFSFFFCCASREKKTKKLKPMMLILHLNAFLLLRSALICLYSFTHLSLKIFSVPLLLPKKKKKKKSLSHSQSSQRRCSLLKAFPLSLLQRQTSLILPIFFYLFLLHFSLSLFPPPSLD